MTQVKRIVQEKVNASIQSLGEDIYKRAVKPLKPEYFVVYKDGKIENPYSDEFLKNEEFKIAFAFPCISYIPNSQRTQTLLRPITINNAGKISIGSIAYENWTLYFFDQDLRRQSLPFEVLIEREDVDFKQRLYNVKKEDIALHLRLFSHVLDCTSKKQAEFLLSMYNKEEEIYELNKTIRRQNREINKLSTGAEQNP